MLSLQRFCALIQNKECCVLNFYFIHGISTHKNYKITYLLQFHHFPPWIISNYNAFLDIIWVRQSFHGMTTSGGSGFIGHCTGGSTPGGLRPLMMPTLVTLCGRTDWFCNLWSSIISNNLSVVSCEDSMLWLLCIADLSFMCIQHG